MLDKKKDKEAKQVQGEGLVEYSPGSLYPGKIGRTLDESSPAWPAPIRAKEGAPNVLFWIIDDNGYGQLSPFGGLVDTPNLDRLAKRGLCYTAMHTTALCSPTRGCVLTGRNHHTLGLSAITELSMGYPAHNGMMGLEHGMLSEILRENGYNSFCIGKWHMTPPEETTPAGPYRRWPLGRGFERYYGFLGGDTDQWYPDLTYDNHQVVPPKTPDEGYHLNVDLADKAIEFIQDAHVNAPDKPFFLYYATGAGHAPHHVEKEWINKYKGKFDMGWDKYRETVFDRQKKLGIVPQNTVLSKRDPDVPAWDSLSADAKRMFARQMEVFAAFMSQTDSHFGRILDFLEKIGELDNTFIVVLSDNGASAEGGPEGSINEMLFFNNAPEKLEDNLRLFDEWGGVDTFPHYSWGWTWAGDTPFRRWKRETFRGGTADPCIVFWPKGMKSKGEVRSQYAHAIDLVPTVLEALGIEPPTEIRGVTQSEIQGVSFAHTFNDVNAATKHHTQYYEMFGHRAIYHEGWRAVCPFPGPSFAEAAKKQWYFGMPLTAQVLEELEKTGWELYHTAEDPAETKNLATENPEKLREMIERWWTEADRYGALPLATADLARMNTPRPKITKDRKKLVFYAGGAMVPFAAVPRVFNIPHSITADVVIPKDGAEGVLLANGNRHVGYALYVKDRKLHYVHNYLGLEKFKVSSPKEIPTGKVSLRYEFESTGKPDFKAGKGAPGRGQLYINGELVANIEMPYTVPVAFGIIGLSCGYDAADSVMPEDYKAPFAFTGEIKQVVVDLTGELIQDDEAILKRMMARQ